MFNTTQAIAPLRPLLKTAFIMLAMLSLSRIGLLAWQLDRWLAQPDWHLALLGGIRIDVATVCIVLVFATLALPILSLLGKKQPTGWKIMNIYFSVMFGFMLFMEVATPTFIGEYSLRPNRLFVEYLEYPNEVFGMLATGYKLPVFLALIVLALGVITFVKTSRAWFTQVTPIRFLPTLVLSCCLIFVWAVGIRSNFGHRPLNPAMVAFASDPLINDLTLNSTYSVGFAIKAMRAEEDSNSMYGNLPQEEIIRLARTSAQLEPTPEDEAIPSLHLLKPSFKREKPLNVVVLLQESLGARFVGALGGQQLTPNLDKLIAEGWAFKNFYATGTRSVRGIEAVTTGFPPTPSRAVVKLSKSQSGFFTIADLLKRRGYHTQFIYGGEAHFDNMRSFMLGNGFSEVIDLPKFDKPSFVGSWGAADEDMYSQTHKELTNLHAAGKPFYTLSFTVTNHTPYEYPEGRIKAEGAPDTRENAIRYSDWALGEFIKKAKQSPYWENTIFWIVADHDARVYEANVMPVPSFHIPSVLVGGPIETRMDERLASSIDITPTLLSLAGIEAFVPTLGNDLTQEIPPEKQRAMFQYDKMFGYMRPGKVTVLQPDQAPKTYAVTQQWQVDKEQPLDEAMAKEALANVTFANFVYQGRAYKLPE